MLFLQIKQIDLYRAAASDNRLHYPQYYLFLFDLKTYIQVIYILVQRCQQHSLHPWSQIFNQGNILPARPSASSYQASFESSYPSLTFDQKCFHLLHYPTHVHLCQMPYYSLFRQYLSFWPHYSVCSPSQISEMGGMSVVFNLVI